MVRQALVKADWRAGKRCRLMTPTEHPRQHLSHAASLLGCVSRFPARCSKRLVVEGSMGLDAKESTSRAERGQSSASRSFFKQVNNFSAVSLLICGVGKGWRFCLFFRRPAFFAFGQQAQHLNAYPKFKMRGFHARQCALQASQINLLSVNIRIGSSR